VGFGDNVLRGEKGEFPKIKHVSPNLSTQF
jgi:hypothetical protein